MRRKKRFELPVNDVNVVPLMDILTTMLFFLILMASMSKYSALMADAEISNMASTEEKKQRFDLVIWIRKINSIELHLGAFDKIKVMKKEELISELKKTGFIGSQEKGLEKKYFFKEKEKEKLIKELQQNLMAIKKSFPHEMKITLVIEDRIKFQAIIDFMTAVTEVDGSLDEIELENFLGKREKGRVLFPEIALREMDEVDKTEI